MKPKLLISSLVVSVLLLAGTGFAYQGQLKNASGPVNNVCDMQFSLWDAAGSSSSPIGGTPPGFGACYPPITRPPQAQTTLT